MKSRLFHFSRRMALSTNPMGCSERQHPPSSPQLNLSPPVQMPMIARRAAQQGRVGALVLLLALAFAPATTHALDNGVGRTPALAWSSWNYFMNDFNETVIKGIADGMVPSGAANSGEPGGASSPLGPAILQESCPVPIEFACDLMGVTYQRPPGLTGNYHPRRTSGAARRRSC